MAEAVELVMEELNFCSQVANVELVDYSKVTAGTHLL